MTNMNLGMVFLGDTYEIAFKLTQRNGSAQDLTSATVRFGLATQDCLKTPFYTATIGSGIEITDAVNGEGKVTIPKGRIDKTGRLFYELEATLPTGESYTYAQGYLTVRPVMFPA